MKHYWLRLTPEQAVHLDDPTIIPGRAIRGAVAAILLRGCIPGYLHDAGACGAQCRYWPVFGARIPVRFSDAYAANRADGDDAAPFPATARTCSVRPGFREGGGHGVFDSALRVWTFESALHHSDQLLIPYELRCSACGADVTLPDGILARISARQYRAVSGILSEPVPTTHAPINRARRRAMEPFIQDGAALNRTAVYVGWLDVPDAQDMPIRAALAEGLSIGGRRTRGMGAMRAELIARPDPVTTLSERIAAFNRVLRAERRFYEAMSQADSLFDPDEDGWYFTLDVSGLPVSAKAPALLSDIKALREVRITRQWIAPRVGGGRSTATQLPIRGAALVDGVILCGAPPDADRAELEQALAYLETHGTDRGVGTVRVCDPFHLEIEPL